MSLPTNATWRSRPSRGRASPERAAGRRLVAGEGVVAPRRSPAAARRAASAAHPGRGLRARRAGGTPATSTPGRPEARAGGQAVVVHRRPQALGGVARADEDRARAGARPSRASGQEALGVALDDVLERAAVDLHRVGDVVAERAGEDDRAHHEVVGQRDVGPRARGDVADGGDVARRRSARSPRRCSRGTACAVDALVAVGDVDGQQVADVRPPRRHADGLAQDLDPRLRRPPTCRRRRRTAAPAGGAPGRAGRPSCAGARERRRPAGRCRRSSRSRAGGSRGRRGCASRRGRI